MKHREKGHDIKQNLEKSSTLPYYINAHLAWLKNGMLCYLLLLKRKNYLSEIHFCNGRVSHMHSFLCVFTVFNNYSRAVSVSIT